MKGREELLNIISALFYEAEDIDDILQRISALASELVSAESSAILIFSEDRSHLYFKSSQGKTAPILRRISVNSGVTWWVAQNGTPVIINDVRSDARFTGAIDRATGFKTRNLICVPIFLDGRVIGVLEAANKLNGEEFTREDLSLFKALGRQIAVAIRNAERMERYRNFFSNSIEIFVKAIETVGVLRNMMFPGHCWRVAEISTFIAQMMEVDGEELNNLYYGAVLHDIGVLECREMGVWEPMPEEPWENAKHHPVWGANIVREMKLLKEAAPIIRHHHENYDGTGYPDGLKGEEIPIGARIIAVAERYEELLLLNPPEMKGSKGAVADKIREMSGVELDPNVVEIFLSEVLRWPSSGSSPGIKKAGSEEA
jgi:putative nucleotidyltransferase with HDIG domain